MDDDQLKELEISTLDLYKNQSWTRLIVIGEFLAGEQENYPIGPDLFKELEAMHHIDEDNCPEWSANFDPLDFQKKYKDIKIEDWRFTSEEIEQYANIVQELRA